MPPCNCALNELRCARDAVHGGHSSMQMKLDALLGRFVLLFYKVYSSYGARIYAVALHIRVVIDNASDHNGDAVFDIFQQAFAIFGKLENLDGIGACLIGDTEIYYLSFSVAGIARFKRKHSTPYDDRARIGGYVRKRNGLCLYYGAINRNGIFSRKRIFVVGSC